MGKMKKITAHPAVWLSGMAVLFLLLSAGGEQENAVRASWSHWVAYVTEQLGEKALAQVMPIWGFVGEGEESIADRLMRSQMCVVLPVFEASLQEEEKSQETLHILELAQLVEEAESVEEPDTVMIADDVSDEKEEVTATEREELLLTEQQNVSGDFTPHSLQQVVDLNELKNYETLVEQCYSIDPNTMAGSDQLNVETMLAKDMTLAPSSEGPQILIYHTHSQEAFADSVPGDTGTSIVGVGERLAGILTQRYGYSVLHHMGEYDVESRDEAYTRALPAMEQLLEANPTIEVIIDLHRDQMAEHTRLVTDIDGRPTARFMFFNGMSRTKKTGNIDYLYNPNLEDNLAFSFQMELAAMEYYPGLTRKIYLKGYRYNMHLRPKNLLIELGAQNNTVEEAMNACEPLAHILHLVLSGEAKQESE